MLDPGKLRLSHPKTSMGRASDRCYGARALREEASFRKRRLQSERRCNGQITTENRFFISSLPSQAALLMNAVRTHWSIENSLHWVLDVSFDEDACRIRRASAAHNMALLRHLALNLLSKDSSSKRGIAARRKKAAWDQTYLIKLLTQ